MLIEIGAPASLPLGLVRVEHDNRLKTCLLGLTVQHPPVDLLAQTQPTGFQITGGRADRGYEQAIRFLAYHHLPHQAEVEIELAIPAFTGLGSETMLALSLARALAWVHNLPPPQQATLALAEALSLEPRQALEVWGFDQGGLLLVDVEAPLAGPAALLRRQEIAHPEKEDWALVFLLPRVPKETPESLEMDRLVAMLQAAPHLSPDSGRLVMSELWPAVENDDIAAFGQSLLALQHMNQAALASAGLGPALSPDDQAVLELMRDHGALAWGQSLTGLCLYGLVKGATASIELRKKLRHELGFFAGTIMATITDNTGRQQVIKDENLADKQYKPYRLNI